MVRTRTLLQLTTTPLLLFSQPASNPASSNLVSSVSSSSIRISLRHPLRNREDFSRYQRRWFGVKGKIPKKDGYSAAACDSSGVRRAYVWSHHIYAKKKKREIPELAKKLSLSGFCSTGKPGFIIVEGAEPDVKRFLSTVKRWPWQRFDFLLLLIVRVQENADERAFPNFQMTGAGGGEKNDLREVRKLMDNAGVGEHFEAVAGINEIKSG